MLAIALLLMISATLIQHLGLAEAITDVLSKIASCSTCCTFWICLAGLTYLGTDIIYTVVLSIFMAYLSNWLVLLLIWLQELFNRLYGTEDNTEGGDSEEPTNTIEND